MPQGPINTLDVTAPFFVPEGARLLYVAAWKVWHIPSVLVINMPVASGGFVVSMLPAGR